MIEAVRAGHNKGVPGAHALVDEVTEDRLYCAAVEKYLRILGDTVVDVTPGTTSTSGQDLTYGVNKANEANADGFESCHVNAAGGRGVEVLYYPGSEAGRVKAERICKAVAELGFPNRGAKADVRGLYEPKHTHMTAVIIEPFFCDNAADVALYKKIGPDALGKAIAEGITGRKVQATPPVIKADANYKVVTVSALNVRSSASAADDKNIIGKLQVGTKVRIGFEKNGWTNIYFGEHGGFVASRYLK